MDERVPANPRQALESMETDIYEEGSLLLRTVWHLACNNHGVCGLFPLVGESFGSSCLVNTLEPAAEVASYTPKKSL